MITRTEVQEAILACEVVAGWGPLDMSTVTITRGRLHVLIEAAKCARYTGFGHNPGESDSNRMLDNDYLPKPKPKPIHCYDDPDDDS